MERALLSQLAGKILRAQDVQNGLSPLQFSRTILASRQWDYLRHLIPVSEAMSPAPVAEAQIWQGGWVVPCPLCKTGLEYGDPDEPVFLCCSCWNAEMGGKLLQVAYPPQHRAIEATLVKRASGKTRGWISDESLADLQADNVRMGVE